MENMFHGAAVTVVRRSAAARHGVADYVGEPIEYPPEAL